MPVQQTIHVRATRAEVIRALRQVPRLVSGRGGASPLVKALQVRIGLAALSKIKQAFVVKACGGTDEAGERWRPLVPATIAYSRRHPGVPKKRPFWTFHPSFAVTKRQRARWWALYYGFKRIFHGNKGKAAALAWINLKRESGYTIVTLYDRYAGTPVEILRDTGLLFNSLSPGVPPAVPSPPVPPPKPPHQVFRFGTGGVIVGTNRRFAGTHHRGVPRRIPQRRLWPAPGRWPSSWWSAITEQARLGVLDLVIFLLRGVP